MLFALFTPECHPGLVPGATKRRALGLKVSVGVAEAPWTPEQVGLCPPSHPY